MQRPGFTRTFGGQELSGTKARVLEARTARIGNRNGMPSIRIMLRGCWRTAQRIVVFARNNLVLPHRDPTSPLDAIRIAPRFPLLSRRRKLIMVKHSPFDYILRPMRTSAHIPI